VLAAPYLFWPAQADDDVDVSVYVRLIAVEDVLGIVGYPRKGSQGSFARAC